MGLNGLLGFKSPTYLMSTQTHPFDTPSISIAFDPKNSPHYQVICVCDCDRNLFVDHRQIKIYNSDMGSWRDSGNPFVVSDEFLFERGVFWKGAMHWVSKGVLSLRFDVERELLLTMPMPPIPEGWAERRLKYFGHLVDQEAIYISLRFMAPKQVCLM